MKDHMNGLNKYLLNHIHHLLETVKCLDYELNLKKEVHRILR